MTLVTNNGDDDPTDAAASTRTRAAKMTRDARTAVRGAVESTREQAGTAFDQAQDAVRETGETVASSLLKFADSRKDKAAQGFREMSRALFRAGDETGDNRMARQMAEAAAEACDTVAGLIEERSTSESIDSVTRYARANPATFAMGSLIAGFAIGRLLTAGPTHRNDHAQGRSGTENRTEPGYQTEH